MANYSGEPLARAGVVRVNLAYRVGALGFLSHPALSREQQGRSGNYGLMDQIAALRWVQRNIASFGGDPAKVTVAGESAGGLSALYLMTSPQARGLFRGVIAQSSYMISMPELHRPAHGLPAWEVGGQLLGKALGAPTIAELRKRDAAELTGAAAKAGFFPFGTVDGVLLQASRLRELAGATALAATNPVLLVWGDRP